MKQINFKQSWCEAIAQFDAEVRCEIYAATVAYSLEGIIPEGMSDLARGAFAFIKADIDASRRRAGKARATRLARLAESESQPVEKEPQAKPDGLPVVAAPAPLPPQPLAQVATTVPGPRPRHNTKPKTQAALRRRAFNRAVERRIRALRFA